MPTLGSVSGNALASLTAIDQWISTLNSSVAGASRTGFKTSKITFGGGTTRIDKLASGGALGIQFAEQAMTVGATNVDFSEGEVTASTEYTHLALHGNTNAFFMLSDISIPSGTTAATLPTGVKFYYTRDGEFHLDSSGRLVNSDGLFLVGRQTTGASALTNFQTAQVTGSDTELALNTLVEEHNTPPAALTASKLYIGHALIKDVQSLKFSKYGSTVFEQADPTVPAQGTGSTDLFQNAIGNSSKVRISTNALEASNVQLPSSLVELSLAQKIYSALTKVITIDQQKLDNIMNLIR